MRAFLVLSPTRTAIRVSGLQSGLLLRVDSAGLFPRSGKYNTGVARAASIMVKHLGTYILAAYLGSIHLGSHAAGTSSEKGFFRYLVVMFLPRCADLFFIVASFTDPRVPCSCSSGRFVQVKREVSRDGGLHSRRIQSLRRAGMSSNRP